MSRVEMGVIPEPERPVLKRAICSGYGYEKYKKNRYGAGTLKMGMGRVWVWE